MVQNAESRSPVLFYDGVCGFCNKMIRWLIAADPRAAISYASLQSPLGEDLYRRHPELRSEDTAILQEILPDGSERISIRSKIPVTLHPYLQGLPKLLLSPFALLPRSLGDKLYEVIAGSRYKLFGKYETCPIPAPEVRSRFIA